jgi:hypothetical protein
MGVSEMKREFVDWVHVGQDRDRWLALVNAVTNLVFPLKAGNSLLYTRVLVFEGAGLAQAV